MDVIDGNWIRTRLPASRGEGAKFARHMGWDSAKLAKVFKGERKVQAEEIPKVLDYFREDELPALPATTDVALVPIYDVSASAGNGIVSDDYVPVTRMVAFAMEYLRVVLGVDPKHSALITVHGDSMSPTLHDGDFVLVDMSIQDLGEGVYVFVHDGGVNVKRVMRSARAGYFLAIPDNPRYREQEYNAEDVRIIGRVRWHGGLI